jgi:hypothetical protein
MARPLCLASSASRIPQTEKPTMTRTVTDCDRCVRKEIQPVKVYIHVGWETGGPGPSEEEQEIRELCPECGAAALHEVLKLLTMEQRQQLAVKWKRK